MTTPLRCLIVEDSEDDALLVLRQLRAGGFDVAAERVDTPEAMRTALDRQPWDLVLSDYKMPHFSAIAALELLKASGLDLPFIIVSGTIGEATAVEAMKAGAHDYVMKDRLARLVPAVQRELRDAELRREGRRAEVALQESEERYRLLFATSMDAVFLTAPDGEIFAANEAACRMFGRTEEELLRLGRNGIVDVADPRLAAALAERTRTGRFQGELKCRRSDGTMFPGELSTAVFTDRAGRKRTSMVIRDVTERKQAEAALQESEAKLRALFENSSYPMGLAKAGIQIMVNPAFVRMFGYAKAADAVGKPLLEDIAPAERARVEEYGQRRARGESVPKYYETKGIRRDGTVFDMAVAVSTYTAGGEPYIIGILNDITERKRAEFQLREQNEILSQSHEGVVIVNHANQVTLWNRGAEKILGWTAAEARDHPPEQLLGIDDPGVVAAIRAKVEREEFCAGEVQARTRDGRKIILASRISLVRDEEGRPRARLNVFSDITEKKLLEEKFLHVQRLESIGMLAAGIAHDLNNVLAPIVCAAPMLRESLSNPQDLKILDTLEQSAARGAGLVRQILGFVHSTTDEFQPVQVKHLARDVIGLIEETFPRSIQLEHLIPSDLWLVQGNPTHLHQVLLNLCVNARDAMPQGGTLRLTAANRSIDRAEAGAMPGAQPGAWLVLEVSDTGTGMPPEVLQHIWEPFFTTKGIGKGTGLGLSTVRGIVVSHGGFIELHTEAGRGTTFRVFLPAISGESDRPGTVPPFAPPEGHGELILVVDDDTLIRDTVATILEQHGYHTMSCSDGVEALALFASHADKISLVLTDVDMPKISGAALAQTLLHMRPGILILAMSGLSRRDTGGSDVVAIKDLAHAFLLKPFKAEDLLDSIHRLLHTPEKP